MVRHLIFWQLKDEISAEDKAKIVADIRQSLEALKGRIAGLKEISVQTEKLASSNLDVMLDCLLDDEEALKAYASHPEHIAVAANKIVPFVKSRQCIDYVV